MGWWLRVLIAVEPRGRTIPLPLPSAPPALHFRSRSLGRDARRVARARRGGGAEARHPREDCGLLTSGLAAGCGRPSGLFNFGCWVLHSAVLSPNSAAGAGPAMPWSPFSDGLASENPRECASAPPPHPPSPEIPFATWGEFLASIALPADAPSSRTCGTCWWLLLPHLPTCLRTRMLWRKRPSLHAK